MPFARRQTAAEPEVERPAGRRAARRLELCQRTSTPPRAATAGQSTVRNATELGCMAGEAPSKCSTPMPAEPASRRRWNRHTAAEKGWNTPNCGSTGAAQHLLRQLTALNWGQLASRGR